MKPLLWLFLKFLPLWLLAMVIGFTIAWWQRGREARRQFARLKERLAAEKEQTSIATQQALEFSESYSRLADEIKELKQNQPAVAEEDSTLLANDLTIKDRELNALQAAKRDLEKQLKAFPTESEIRELRTNTDSQKKQIEELHGELQAAQENIEALQAEVEHAELQTSNLLSENAEPESAANTKAKAASNSAVPAAFAEENVTQDRALGIIFPKAPKQADDLTEINGIGPVIAGKLNDFGVYRFQQIALWDQAVVEEFSRRLKSFRNRIERDGWRQQATALHDHYHES